MPEYFAGVRRNVLELVHYGFTREECYFMPISEMIDYINILNRQREQEAESIAKTSSTVEEKDISMAGNTLPGKLF